MSTHDRKQREFERRGQDILDAALSLFQLDDWEPVMVDTIARKADVAKRTLYKHVASKDEICARLAMRFQRAIALETAEIDASLPLLERFRQHLQVARNLHLSSKELHRVFMVCNRVEFRSRLTPAVMQELQAVEAAVAKPGFDLVTEGIEQGVFLRQPIAPLLIGLQAAFWGGIQQVWSAYLSEIDQAQRPELRNRFLLAGLIDNDQIHSGRLSRRPPFIFNLFQRFAQHHDLNIPRFNHPLVCVRQCAVGRHRSDRGPVGSRASRCVGARGTVSET